MHYSNLSATPIREIVDCLTEAFTGYFVEMPSDVGFWETRLKNARVDYALSWGVFDQGKLVGFVLNAIDDEAGVSTAFNTGTGVVQGYRGRHLVDKMYEYGIPNLVKNGVSRCTLEVIDQNERAIRVYQRIGFVLRHRLKCFKGILEAGGKAVLLESTPEQAGAVKFDGHYSWDNTTKTIAAAGEMYRVYEVLTQGQPAGYFIINPENGYVAQLESTNNAWDLIFDGISQIQRGIKINNIPENRQDLLAFLDTIGLENTIDQFEMEMSIG